MVNFPPSFWVGDLSFDIIDGVVENLNLFDITLLSADGSIGGAILLVKGCFASDKRRLRISVNPKLLPMLGMFAHSCAEQLWIDAYS